MAYAIDAMREMQMATAPKGRATKAAAEKAVAPVKTATETAKEAMETAFSYPKFEVPEMVRSFAEQGLMQTREAYGRVKDAAEHATDLMEDSLETGRKSVREAQFKTLDMAKANTDATFELMRQLLTATTVSDALQIQTAFARERYEAFVGYSKDIQDMMTKASAEASKPAKAIFEKSLRFPTAA
jgi:phasin